MRSTSPPNGPTGVAMTPVATATIAIKSVEGRMVMVIIVYMVVL